MIPILFSLGPLHVYSYGLMLGISFLLGTWVLGRDLRRKKLDPDMASTIMVLGVIFGIGGAKVLFLIEEWQAFVRDPFGLAFAPGGLTWHGGLLLGIIAVSVYLRRKKAPFLRVWDSIGLALILAYGVGRVGCHLSGDGDYGPPTQLPWGTIYAQGTAKPTTMLETYFIEHPVERTFWHYDSLRVIVAGKDRLGHVYTRFDEVTPLHPSPLYELVLGILGFAFLLWLRKRPAPDGQLFAIYLMVTAVFRFLIEFLRLNPHLALGLSEAQLISIVLFAGGLAGLWWLRRTAATKAPA
jgi:phosphatidylglycerol---prolipoprotein diacylglyceryl transferase